MNFLELKKMSKINNIVESMLKKYTINILVQCFSNNFT